MSSKVIARGLFFAIALMAIAQCIHDFPLLPDRMASHFAASGAPNGWMTKIQFFIVFAIVFLPALFVEFWLHAQNRKNTRSQNQSAEQGVLAGPRAPRENIRIF